MMFVPGAAIWSATPQGFHICTGGPTWSATTAAASDAWSGIAATAVSGKVRLVATAQAHGSVTPINTQYSDNGGATWTLGGTIPNTGGSTPFGPAADASGNLVAWVDFVTCTYSNDGGVTWTNQGAGVSFGCNDIRFGNGRFVFLAQDNTTKSSPTGKSILSLGTPAQGRAIFWNANAGYWILFESAGVRTWTSPDLIVWTQRGNMPQNGVSLATPNRGIAQQGSTVVAVYQDPTTAALVSTDNGLTWALSNVYPGAANLFTSIVSGNGIFIASRSLGGQTYVSSDGLTWTAGNLMTATKTWLIAYNGVNTYAAVGNSGSSDLITNVGQC